jgi:hypothetical protein
MQNSLRAEVAAKMERYVKAVLAHRDTEIELIAAAWDLDQILDIACSPAPVVAGQDKP